MTSCFSLNRSLRWCVVSCLLFMASSIPLQAADTGDADDERRQLEDAERLVQAWPERQNALSDAQRIVDAVLARNPRASEGYRLRAMILMRDGYISGNEYRPDALIQAERSVDAAISNAPDNDRAYVLRADLYRSTGRDAQSRADLKRAETLAPNNPWVQFGWADHHFADKQWSEAAQRCREGAKRGPDDIDVQVFARSCLIRYHRRLGQDADVENLYREQIAIKPSAAWTYGSYAQFLQCKPGRRDDAIAQARAAIRIMDYGLAHQPLAVALYLRWADEVRMGQHERADITWREARAEGAVDVAALIEEACAGKPLYDALFALRATGRAQWYSPEQAIPLAAKRDEETGRMLPGVFRMKVVATGRDQDRVFLNSMQDYRDPRCLTLRFGPTAREAFRRAHGVEPDVFFMGKDVTVVGVARRARIEILPGSNTAQSHYYQTHVDVVQIEQIELFDDMPASPDRG
jgi:Tfp pilus assembly protein PilF